MRLTKFARGCVVAMTCLSMLSSQLVHAAGQQPSTRGTSATATPAPTQDIALQEQGVFLGTLVDDKGAGKAAVPVVVTRQGELVAKTETDANGRFEVRGLTGGVYEIQTPLGSRICRLWAPRTAPPSAKQVATVVADGQDQSIVRAQGPMGGSAFSWLANPWVLAGIVAAAIAIPLALDDDDAS